MTNKENINATIAVIKDPDYPFEMATIERCIIGVVQHIADVNGSEPEQAAVSHFLGLSESRVTDLCCPLGVWDCIYSREDAIQVLEHLRDTGAVDWSITGAHRSFRLGLDGTSRQH